MSRHDDTMPGWDPDQWRLFKQGMDEALPRVFPNDDPDTTHVLYVLAGLSSSAGPFVDVLQRAGITPETVLWAIRSLEPPLRCVREYAWTPALDYLLRHTPHRVLSVHDDRLFTLGDLVAEMFRNPAEHGLREVLEALFERLNVSQHQVRAELLALVPAPAN
jgi:hypothetical protein